MTADSTALPKYLQTAEMLIREIAAGRLLDGERLAPERDMASELGIAVGTLRKALSDLEEKGLLERVHGSGNYVRYRPDAGGVYAFFRLELIDGGGLPTAEVLALDLVAKPDDLPAFGASPAAHRIRRLRRLSGVTAALEEVWLDAARAPALRPQDLSESLYLFYRQRLGLHIARAEDRVGVAPVPDWAPAGFPVAPGVPAGFVERRSMAAEGEVAEFSRTWFDFDKVRYVSRIR